MGRLEATGECHPVRPSGMVLSIRLRPAESNSRRKDMLGRIGAQLISLRQGLQTSFLGPMSQFSCSPRTSLGVGFVGTEKPGILGRLSDLPHTCDCYFPGVAGRFTPIALEGNPILGLPLQQSIAQEKPLILQDPWPRQRTVGWGLRLHSLWQLLAKHDSAA